MVFFFVLIGCLHKDICQKKCFLLNIDFLINLKGIFPGQTSLSRHPWCLNSLNLNTGDSSIELKKNHVIIEEKHK